MKAVLLAAGLGTRLRPLTDATPKCLVDIGGRPLVDLWLDALWRVGAGEVLVNVHHLAEQVVGHLSRRRAAFPSVRVFHEPELLGSAGTLIANRDWLKSGGTFIVVNADNLTDFDLSKLLDSHAKERSLATVSVFRAPDPTGCGIVELDHDLVVGFEEKPPCPRSDLANAGMYAFEPDVLDILDNPPPLDIGRDLLPRLVGVARAVSIGEAFFVDIGTPKALARARQQWQRGVHR